MPLVNIHFKSVLDNHAFQEINAEFKKFLAKKLTCNDISLSPNEISVRFVNVDGGDMIADIEVEIVVHAFPERIKKQDIICLKTAEYLVKKTGIKGIKVWLQLSELGHSW